MSITYRGETIWSCDDEGIAWSFEAGSSSIEVVEERAPLGTGYWVKQSGRGIAEHSLSMTWLTTDMPAIKSVIDDLMDGGIGSLVVPDWGTFPNCRIASTSAWQSRRSAESDSPPAYILTVSLTFSGYPSSVGGVIC